MGGFAWSQGTDTTAAMNTADRLLSNPDKLSIGGYGQIDYNQGIRDDVKSTGALDVHRMVLMFGYKFNERTKFITELEFEHVSEVYVEQAFLQYRINDYINFRGGLMLVPMGIVNEYHEPTTFNGVERPNLDSYVVPSTWREIGLGFTGNIQEASLKYQVYIMNGFNGYDGSAKFNGKKGLRSGRQKGAESFMSSPVFAGKLDYYGIPGLKLGAAAYIGNSQSVAYDGAADSLITTADSTVVGISMFGIDFRYTWNALHIRGQYIIANLTNTEAYNTYTTSDVGSQLNGYYVELGYDLFSFGETDQQLILFGRYENYDTHAAVDDENITSNDAYNRTEITTGLSWKITPGAVLKADYQLLDTDADDTDYSQFNMGVAVWF